MIRFALIGCGKIAERHAELLFSRVPGAALVAVCDQNVDRAKKLAGWYGIKPYVDYKVMLEKESIDVVCILTPSGSHAAIGQDVAQFGKHMVVEKPLSLRLEEADILIQVCKEKKVRLFEVKQNRFNRPVQALRKSIEQGRLGKLTLGTVRVRWTRDQSYYDQEPWRGTWAYDGGVLANQANHHMDMLLWMMGDVDRVYARTSTRLVTIEAEDTAAVVLSFKSGALGIIEATTATRPKDIEGSVSVLGERGTVEIGGFSMDRLVHWKFANTDAWDEEVAESWTRNPEGVSGYAHQEYLTHVVACLTQNMPALVDGEEAKKTLQVLHAIYTSAHTGKEVSLSDNSPVFSPLGQLGLSNRL